MPNQQSEIETHGRLVSWSFVNIVPMRSFLKLQTPMLIEPKKYKKQKVDRSAGSIFVNVYVLGGKEYFAGLRRA